MRGPKIKRCSHIGPRNARPGPLGMGRTALNRSSSSARLSWRSGECLPWPAATSRSLSLTSRYAPPLRAGLCRAPIQAYAHSSTLSPVDAVHTAMWACGRASCTVTHSLAPLLRADSDMLMRLSTPRRACYRPQGADRWPCTSLCPS